MALTHIPLATALQHCRHLTRDFGNDIIPAGTFDIALPAIEAKMLSGALRCIGNHLEAKTTPEVKALLKRVPGGKANLLCMVQAMSFSLGRNDTATVAKDEAETIVSILNCFKEC